MKQVKSFAGLLAVAVGLLCITPQAEAVPAFARQMGVACNTCHFQHFPLLNAFGRAFKASGFTMTGTSLIESDHFSLPANLNAAIFTNIRYQKSSGKISADHNSNNGEWIIPGETSLFVGGRVSPHVGALIEGDVGAGGLNGGGFLASIKVPVLFPVTNSIHAGLVPFSAGLGPAYAFETLNTGAVGNHLINLVTPTAISALQYVQVGANSATDGSSEGIALVAASSNFFVNIAKWSPNHSPVDAFGGSATPTSDYVRVAYTPQIDKWDVGMGFQYFGGRSNMVGQNDSSVDTTDPACPTACPIAAGSNTYMGYKTHAWAVDAQVQGHISALDNAPIGVYFGYAQAPGSAAADNLYNTGSKTKKAASIAAELGAFDNGRGTVQVAYRWGKSGDATYSTDNATTLGLTYLPWNNVQVALYQTFYSGGAHSNAALAAGFDPVIDASGSGKSLTSLNLAIGF
jgi:hypothetical protein